MSAAQLVNLWAPFAGEAYPGYLVMHPAPPLDEAALAALGLEAVDSVPPLPVETISWLNLFYAVEWVVFAGFAVYLWYRLARDDWEDPRAADPVTGRGRGGRSRCVTRIRRTGRRPDPQPRLDRMRIMVLQPKPADFPRIRKALKFYKVTSIITGVMLLLLLTEMILKYSPTHVELFAGGSAGGSTSPRWPSARAASGTRCSSRGRRAAR